MKLKLIFLISLIPILLVILVAQMMWTYGDEETLLFTNSGVWTVEEHKKHTGTDYSQDVYFDGKLEIITHELENDVWIFGDYCDRINCPRDSFKIISSDSMLTVIMYQDGYTDTLIVTGEHIGD